MAEQTLMRLDELEEGAAKALVARVDGKQRNIFVVHKDGGVFAYLNWCPHAQDFIDQVPGQFFSGDKKLIRCGKHGALFTIDDGRCVGGPAEGQSLVKLSVGVRDGEIILDA